MPTVATYFFNPSPQLTGVGPSGSIATIAIPAAQQALDITGFVVSPKTPVCERYDVVFSGDSAATDPLKLIAKFEDVPCSQPINQPGVFKWLKTDGDGNIYCKVTPRGGTYGSTNAYDIGVYIG